MSFVKEKLNGRRLPAIPESREEIIRILSENIYGTTPSFRSEVTAKQVYIHKSCFGGIARHIHYDITATTPCGDFTFRLRLSHPKTEDRVPLMLCISFENDVPSGFIPEEELIRKGIAIARFTYTDIAADDKYNCFESGIARLFPREKGRTDNWGAIGMWAWAASRSLDFLLTLDMFEESRIAVVGHSRLGKTALWCAAQDERFTHAFSNNAGCSGDSITRGKVGEQIADITRNFPHWFCEKYFDYVGDGIANMPFDQHFLLAAIAPRCLAIGASSLDEWADPESEFLCCHAASKAWTDCGLEGFIAPLDRFPIVGESFSEGDICYHLRFGTHNFCREDWLYYADFFC